MTSLGRGPSLRPDAARLARAGHTTHLDRGSEGAPMSDGPGADERDFFVSYTDVDPAALPGHSAQAPASWLGRLVLAA